MGLFHTAALAVLLACGTITASIHIPRKRPGRRFLRRHRRVKHVCENFTSDTDWNVNVEDAEYPLHMGDIPYRGNCCRTCWMGAEDAPRLYIPYRHDGVGMRAVAMTQGMAIAAYHNMNFGGGVIDHTKINRCHHKECDKIMNKVFGAWENDIIVPYYYPIDYTFKTIDEMRQRTDFLTTKRESHVLIKDTKIGNRCRGLGFIRIEQYMTQHFLGKLRQQTDLLSRPVQFFSVGPSVAIHVRRGDINETIESRYTPDEYYYGIVEKLRKHLPGADIHVFSTTETQHWVSDAFDGYRSRNITVHLNGDILGDWAHMAQADVFIMAKSAFSHFPAFFNTKCVVYQDFCYEPLSSVWTNGTEILEDQDDLLKNCLKKIG